MSAAEPPFIDYSKFIREDDPQLRLGRVLAGLEAGARSVTEAVKASAPSGMMKPPLDPPDGEFDGFWLTRRQVKDAMDAASAIGQISRALLVRIDPRCKSRLGDYTDQFDGCRCWLPARHQGGHACEHAGVTTEGSEG